MASIRRQEEGWQVQVTDSDHNHEPFAHRTAHTKGRALTEEALQAVLTLGRAGVTPGCIVTSLRHNNEVMATAQDIYNLRQAKLRLACEGQIAVITQQNAKQLAIVNMQLGPMFSEMMGKISVSGLRAAHRQYLQRLDDNRDCQG
ncbi:hypothetical protein PsorP6_007851 [Peronosclerospora sorghi]|uniref:Uncharacterized protein n=1 Tax=Peronosclerospora sorghi TaxID=230839 RepID=A0ACC0W9J2_9STRA|nr:hypothetical protein PsorP6_007851 [Peronosclerospora sorghi]